MSSPDTSLNRSTSSTNSDSSLKLIIKAANQKYEDFIIDEFELSWTIKRLKLYLTENYPQKPESISIRLIYSGKMLHDHWTLSECLRNSSEIKSHIIHLVHSATSKPKESPPIGNSTIDPDNDNELTPDTSSLLSSSSSSSSSSLSSTPTRNVNVSQSFNQIQNDLNNLYHQQQQQQHASSAVDRILTPKERFEQIHSEYLRYYEAQGVLVQENAWYSAYIQQLALYKHMYLEYIQSQANQAQSMNANSSYMPNTATPVTRVTSNRVEVEQQPARQQMNNQPPQAPEQQQQPEARPAPAVADQAQEVEDDWLSLVHNCVSFLVLFSIIFYYSSIERFLVILSIVIILIIYHNGWLTLQRRPAQPRVQRRQERNNGNQEGNQANPENSQQQQQQPESNNPNTFRLFVTFVLTFFTSLVPERPRIAN